MDVKRLYWEPFQKFMTKKKCFEIDWFHNAEKPMDFLNISNVQIPLHSIRYIPGTWNIHFKGSISMIPNLYNGKMVDLSPNIHPSISKNWPRLWRNSRWFVPHILDVPHLLGWSVGCNLWGPKYIPHWSDRHWSDNFRPGTSVGTSLNGPLFVGFPNSSSICRKVVGSWTGSAKKVGGWWDFHTRHRDTTWEQKN